MSKLQKSCLVCSKAFTTYIKTQKFCSHVCAAIKRPPPLKKKLNRKTQTKKCARCTKGFIRKNNVGNKGWSTAKYCSLVCYNSNRRQPAYCINHNDRKSEVGGLCRRCYRQGAVYKNYRKQYRGKPRVRQQHIAYMEEYRKKNREQGVFSRLKRVYGMSKENYFNLLSAQNNKCAICFSESKTVRLAVDHDHATGVVRGLLCNPCNRALGYFKEEITRFHSAINYLEKHKQKDKKLGVCE